MKKLTIAIAVLTLLVIGTFGTSVLAGRPVDTPVDDWGYIKDKADAIWDIVTNSDYGLEAIDDEIETLSDNVALTETTYGVVANTEPGPSIHPLWESESYENGGHFSVTLNIAGCGEHDSVVVTRYWGDASMARQYNGVEDINFEFDGTGIKISYINTDDGADLQMLWGVTITYSSDSIV